MECRGASKGTVGGAAAELQNGSGAASRSLAGFVTHSWPPNAPFHEITRLQTGNRGAQNAIKFN